MRYLSPVEACSLLRDEFGIPRTPATLAKVRCISSDGPAYVKAGRLVRYPDTELREWARSYLSPIKRSTSDRAA